MKYQHLTIEQAEILGETVGRHLKFYSRLRQRIARRRLIAGEFSADVEAAFEKVHTLNIKLHYGSMKSGVYGSPKTHWPAAMSHLRADQFALLTQLAPENKD